MLSSLMTSSTASEEQTRRGQREKSPPTNQLSSTLTSDNGRTSLKNPPLATPVVATSMTESSSSLEGGTDKILYKPLKLTT